MRLSQKLCCVSLLVLFAGCDYQLPLTSFSEFEFTLTLNVCASEGIQHAAITRLDDDTLQLEMSVIEAGNPESPDCVEDIYFQSSDLTDACVVIRDLPPRILTEAEMQQVLDVFTETTFYLRYNDPRTTLCTADVPCTTETFRWDENEFTLEWCPSGFYTWLTSESRAALLDLLESLRSE